MIVVDSCNYSLLHIHKSLMLLVVLYCIITYTGCVIPGAGAFEIAVHASLMSADFMNTIKGRARLGVQVSY